MSCKNLSYRVSINIIGIAILGFIQLPSLELISSAKAQTTQSGKVNKTPQIKQKAVLRGGSQIGLKASSANKYSSGMSLNPELFKRKDESEFSGDTNEIGRAHV